MARLYDRTMTEFRLTQISDTHLTRRYASLTENFHRLSEHIGRERPDLVINTGDLAFDAPTGGDDLGFAQELHAALPVPCRSLPGNHDIGDNPTGVGAPLERPVTEEQRQRFRALFVEDRWQFEAAGWCFIGLNSLVMNSHLACEAEQFDWLASQLSRANGKPIALFLHKPLFLGAPDDPELPETAIRYVPQPARRQLIDMLATSDVRLVASGHVHQLRDFTHHRVRHIWAPSAGFVISDARQQRIGVKQVGLVEYRFRPDSVEVRHLRAAGQVDVDLDALLAEAG